MNTSRNGRCGSTSLERLCQLLLTTPKMDRGALMREVAAFDQVCLWGESPTVGEIRAVFADCWEQMFSAAVPIKELRGLLERPIPIGIVLEFGRLGIVDDSELSSILVSLLNSLCSATTKDAASSASCQYAGTVVDTLDELISQGKHYPTIYADPPWAYKNVASRAAARNLYSTMPLEEICRLPVGTLAAKNAHLHLWTTNGFLREAFDVMDCWGFQFKSCLVWVKDKIGMGDYWRVSHEFLLLGVRGRMTFADRSQRSWLQAPRTIHSRKPPIVRDLIERVSPAPYLELFGREELPNSQWTVFGNQVERRLF